MGDGNSINFRRGIAAVTGLAVLAGLYVASFYNYLLFHTLAEGFSIIVAAGIFMVAWNSRRFLRNNYLLFLGIAYLFIAGVDLLHTMGYKGMSIFPGYDANLPTQLWISARYMESISLLLAPLFLGRKLNANRTLAAYAVVFTVLVWAVFAGFFPDCFVEGDGLTLFKKVSEYVISGILLGSAYFLHRHRKAFDRRVLRMLYASILLTVASETAFTFYVSAYGFSNLVGHYFKLLSFVLIYGAVVVTGLREPYSLLFRELKQSENALREGRERLRLAVQAGRMFAFQWDAATDEVVRSGECAEILGLGGDATRDTGKDFFSMMHPEDRDAFFGVLDGLDPRNEGYTTTYRVLRADNGETVVLEEHARAYFDSGGRLQRVIGMTADITERKRAEEELKKYQEHLEELVEERTASLIRTNEELEQEIAIRKQAEDALAAEKERLAVTLRSIGDGVIATDLDGRIVLVNKVTQKLTGWSQEEALGRYLHEVFNIVDAETREVRESPVERALRSRGIIDLPGNTLLLAKGGVERAIADSCAPIRDMESKDVGAVIVFRDITEKQRMEEELLKAQKLESVGVLAGGIAHDFNNALVAIMANIGIAKRSVDPETRAFERLDDAEKASLRAQDLTRQLMTFTRGGAPVRKVALVGELLRKSADFVLSGSNVECRYSIPEDLLPAEVDEGQINQMISNLVINAKQAMPEGGSIDISAENVSLAEGAVPGRGEGQYLKLSFRDRGCGISQDNMRKIFDPYFTTKEEGSGLGLASVYSIVKRHGGHIAVESEVGRGTTFHVHLPAFLGGEVPSKGKAAKRPDTGRGRVLIMDDEMDIAESISSALSIFGYDVEFAGDGEKAITLYREAREADRPFDAVIMDLTVSGGMGGLEAIRELRKLDPAVRAIVSSGYSVDPVMSEYRKHGFAGVLPKPYLIDDLNSLLVSLIKGG